MKNKPNILESIFDAHAGGRVLIYPLVRAKLLNTFIGSLRLRHYPNLKIDVVVSERYGNRDMILTDNLIILKSGFDFFSRLTRHGDDNYDTFVVLFSWAYVSPKLLVKLLVLNTIMIFSPIRRKYILTIDNALSHPGEIIKQALRTSLMYIARSAKAVFLRLIYPFSEIFFNIMISGRIKKRSGPAKIGKVLFIENDLIGDVVWATPCFSALKKKNPAATIHCLVGSWAKDVIAHNPYVDSVITYDVPWFGRAAGQATLRLRIMNRLHNIKKRIWLFFQRYDLVFDLRGDPRTITLAYFTGAPLRVAYRDRSSNNYAAFMLTTAAEFPWAEVHRRHIVEHNLNVLKAAGIGAAEKDPFVFVDDLSKRNAARFLEAHDIAADDIVVGIHPGASRAQKQWKSEFFAQVADDIVTRFGAKIIITGSVREKKLAEEIAGFMKQKPIIAAGALNLVEFIELVRRLNLLVSVETMTISIASAVKTPLVCLMSGVPALFGPYNLKSEVIVKELACKDPIFEHCLCGVVPYPCLMAIQPEEVCGAVKKIFN